jgi:hypothetical protein
MRRLDFSVKIQTAILAESGQSRSAKNKRWIKYNQQSVAVKWFRLISA